MSAPHFSGRNAIIVTKHGKENVMVPIFNARLQLSCEVNRVFDTDQLGCFSGEIRREDDVQQVLRKKCLAGLEDTNFDIAIASEGSFYPHPQIWFRSCNEERIMIMDKKNNLEITAHTLSLDTNHASKQVSDWDELTKFAEGAGFPQHGLILRSGTNQYTHQMKGIRDIHILKEAFQSLLTVNGTVYVETDMRAYVNPSRMKVIETTAQKLCDKILSLCPICQWPGFSISDYKTGLPCSECEYPTRSVLSVMYKCNHCHHTREELYPKGKKVEDPQYCDQCNP